LVIVAASSATGHNRQSTAAKAALPIPNSFLEIIMICL
jgi:hypothetical protein